MGTRRGLHSPGVQPGLAPKVRERISRGTCWEWRGLGRGRMYPRVDISKIYFQNTRKNPRFQCPVGQKKRRLVITDPAWAAKGLGWVVLSRVPAILCYLVQKRGFGRKRFGFLIPLLFGFFPCTICKPPNFYLRKFPSRLVGTGVEVTKGY